MKDRTVSRTVCKVMSMLYVSMPEDPYICEYISQPDAHGMRTRYVNVAAASSANIVRILDPKRKRRP